MALTVVSAEELREALAPLVDSGLIEVRGDGEVRIVSEHVRPLDRVAIATMIRDTVPGAMILRPVTA